MKTCFNRQSRKTFDIYRNIYNQGVEPKTFLNDFLEISILFKNINSLKENSKNFDLNDKEFELIKSLSDQDKILRHLYCFGSLQLKL